MGRVARLFGRALALRCPRCGRAPALAGWFRVRPHCPACRFRFDRGEPGYFVGAGCINLVAVVLTFNAVIIGTIALTLPRPPWAAVPYLAVPLVILLPLLFFPFSRTLWIAFDLAFRPAERNDDVPDDQG